MKLDKSQIRELEMKIKNCAKANGYKTCSFAMYCIKENCFFQGDFFVVSTKAQNDLIFRVNVKHFDYDDIFWEIMNMKENSSKALSLRAIGAFQAPSIMLSDSTIRFEANADYDLLATSLIAKFEKERDRFLSNFDIDDLLINIDACDNAMPSDYFVFNKEILQCLAYIHKGDIGTAKNIADQAIQNGVNGAFENEGKDFFEWLLSHFS